MTNRFVLGIAAALFVLAVGSVVGTACGLQDSYNDERGTGDAPVGDRDDSPAEVLNMPNGAPNVYMKCDGHGHRVYVATHTEHRQSLVVIDDPNCV